MDGQKRAWEIFFCLNTKSRGKKVKVIKLVESMINQACDPYSLTENPFNTKYK